jgi:hypothetical protein
MCQFRFIHCNRALNFGGCWPWESYACNEVIAETKTNSKKPSTTNYKHKYTRNPWKCKPKKMIEIIPRYIIISEKQWLSVLKISLIEEKNVQRKKIKNYHRSLIRNKARKNIMEFHSFVAILLTLLSDCIF